MAAASTKRYEEGTPLSIFDGIPIGIKEQMAVVTIIVYVDVMQVIGFFSRNRITSVVALHLWEVNRVPVMHQ